MTGTVGIVELLDVCALWRRRSIEAFEVTGRWATTLDVPTDLRLFAAASHRHAWHAELWSTRSPAIPVEPGAGAEAFGWAPDDRRPLAAYHDHLGSMLADLHQLGRRVDADLDPATVRTISLVRADLVELSERSA